MVSLPWWYTKAWKALDSLRSNQRSGKCVSFIAASFSLQVILLMLTSLSCIKSSLNIGLQLRHQQTLQCLPVESKVRQLEDLLDCNCDTNKLNSAFPSNSILINESKVRQLEDLLDCKCDTNKLSSA